jgi:hypothetical protein
MSDASDKLFEVVYELQRSMGRVESKVDTVLNDNRDLRQEVKNEFNTLRRDEIAPLTAYKNKSLGYFAAISAVLVAVWGLVTDAVASIFHH